MLWRVESFGKDLWILASQIADFSHESCVFICVAAALPDLQCHQGWTQEPWSVPRQ